MSVLKMAQEVAAYTKVQTRVWKEGDGFCLEIEGSRMFAVYWNNRRETWEVTKTHGSVNSYVNVQGDDEDVLGILIGMVKKFTATKL